MHFMKKLLAVWCLLSVGTGVLWAQPSASGGKRVTTLYLFGMAASFNDSTVIITDVQQVDSAWVSNRSKFLLGRDEYSTQLRTWLADSMAMSHRTTWVFFSPKREKMVKKRAKMLQLYTIGKKKKKRRENPYYKVLQFTADDFCFRPVFMGDTDDENDPKMIAQRKAEAKQKKAENKAKKKADKAAAKKLKAEQKARKKANKAAAKASKATAEKEKATSKGAREGIAAISKGQDKAKEVAA